GFTIEDLPLWRILVLEEPAKATSSTMQIAFVWHHVIGDGKSGLAVLSTIHEGLNSFSQSINCQSAPTSSETRQSTSAHPTEPEHFLVTASAKPLFPALEEILSLPMSTKTIILHTLGPWLPAWFAKAPAPGKWSG